MSLSNLSPVMLILIVVAVLAIGAAVWMYMQKKKTQDLRSKFGPEYDKAIEDFSVAIRLDPNYALSYENRARAYENTGDYARAIPDYDQLARLRPNNAAVLNSRCWARRSTACPYRVVPHSGG